MLTEGWDANTVTHILGVRAFGTQLLCEQVVGRGLRRMSYAVERRRACSTRSTPRSTACRSRSSRARGATTDPKPGPMPTRVRALEERIACEITFPRLLGYRYELPGERLTRDVHRRLAAGALDRRHPDQDRERADRRRDRRSIRSTT